MCMQHFFRWTFRFHIVAHEIKTLIRKLQIPGVEFQVSQRMLILGFCKLLAPSEGATPNFLKFEQTLKVWQTLKVKL